MQTSDWSKPYQIDPLKVYGDERGALFEMLRFTTQHIPSAGQIYVYSVAPGQRRGDHYHVKKGEWFTCVAGRVQVLLKTKEGEKIEESLDHQAPRLVYVAPYTSHAVVNLDTRETAVIVAYGSKEFDPGDPDTIMDKSD